MGQKKIIALTLLASLLLGIIFVPGYLRIRKLSRKNQELEKQIAEIKQLNNDLKEEQEKLISDPLYFERVAREKLGVVRKGEVVYKILPPEE
ncbi:MAG: septum formation initiator family protein [Omnitrophica bacterium]|nr:septum formation initiator family protein [Candidatus Omnitrophota bacterium]